MALEPIDVEAHFNEAGRPQPQAFIWRGRRFPILGRGRSWRDGSRLHFLVMTPGDLVFELSYAPDTAAWRLVRTPDQRGPRSRFV